MQIKTNVRMMASWFIIGLLTLTLSGLPVTASANPNILVVQNNETRFWYMDYALNLLGISHTNIRINELTTIDLSNYDIVLFGSGIGFLEEVKSYLDARSSDIKDWVRQGGSLGVFCQFVGAVTIDLNGNLVTFPGSGYYTWMPDSPSMVSVSYNSAQIINPSHPITQGLTDDDLSGWGTSPDGYFSSFPGEGLIVQAGYLDRVVLFAQTLGSGRIVGASPDPDIHSTVYNARGQDGINDAKALITNIVNWLTPTSPPPPPVPEFPLGFVFEIAFIPLLCYMWWKRKHKTLQ